MPAPEPERFEFRVESSVPDESTVPAPVLLQVLDGAQRTIFLLGLLQEGREVRERARISADIEEKYVLRCAVPKAGSYVLPAVLGNPQSDLFAQEAIHSVAEKFRRVGEALSKRTMDSFKQIIPDRVMRVRVLEALRSMLPKTGSGWRLTMKTGNAEFARFDETLAAVIQESVKRAEDEGMVTTVTGRLVKIDFSERKLTIHYPVTNREMDCFYDEAVEEMLLENRRDMIQVTGRVTLDNRDQPIKITEVEKISDLDLSPFQVVSVPCKDKTLRFIRPLSLSPKANENWQLLFLEQPDLGIDVFGATRERLLAELHEQIALLWCEYAQADDGSLAPAARKVKERLLASIQEVQSAPQ